MNIKTFFLFFFLLTSSVNLFSQKEIYLDENNIEISQAIFKQKCNMFLFRGLNFNTQEISIEKVIPLYKIGSISKSETSKIYDYIGMMSGAKTDSNRPVIIKFKDTLTGYDIFLTRTQFALEKSRKKVKKMFQTPVRFKKADLSKRTYSKRKNAFIKKQKKCQESTAEIFNATLEYFYRFDNNYLREFPGVWLKDTGIIKENFFKILKSHYTVTLKPNGDYLLGEIFNLEKEFINKFLNEDDIDHLKYDLDASSMLENSYGPNLFEKNHSLKERMCYQ